MVASFKRPQTDRIKIMGGKALGKRRAVIGTTGAAVAERSAGPRPTAEERRAAYEFFVRVHELLDVLGEVALPVVRDKLGIEKKRRANEVDPIDRHLEVAGLETTPVQHRWKNHMAEGLTRSQIERALGRLRPAKPNLYRPESHG
jgi:hypothetical protein